MSSDIDLYIPASSSVGVSVSPTRFDSTARKRKDPCYENASNYPAHGFAEPTLACSSERFLRLSSFCHLARYGDEKVANRDTNIRFGTARQKRVLE